ncbi:hypothetical protein K1719_024513 [Acacia pycnantha]|nr:hypothetical protein K1719_024513 [Acacia pycnantha]
MTRKKVKLAFIGNDSARKTTYKKRKNGMVKKTSELVTLCGVQAFQRTIVRFRNMPEMEQRKKMMNQMSFTRERIQKVSEQVKKMRKSNREKELTQILYHYMSTGIFLQNLTVNDFHGMKWLIEYNLREVTRKMEVMEVQPQNETQIQSQEQKQQQAGEDNNNGKGIMKFNISTLQRQQNFMELMNYAGEETIPFGDANLYHTWPSPFYF